MNSKQEKEKLIEKYSKLSFIEKKKEVLYMLRELYGISDVINTLGERVYYITDTNEEYVFAKVYAYVLDAIYYAKDKDKERAANKLQEINEEFSKIKENENNEKTSENVELDDLIKLLENNN